MAGRKMIYKRFILRDDLARSLATDYILNAPTGVEVIIRDAVKSRSLDQNALMWAALTDISKQAFLLGRRFSAEAWHHKCKEDFLPECHIEGITKEGYQKWDFLPDGRRILVGSTTMLTTRGFSDHMEQIYALGAELGVLFGVKEEQFA